MKFNKKQWIINQWLPPNIVKEIKNHEGWLHLSTTIPNNEDGTIEISPIKGCQYFINGTKVK